MTYSQKSSSRRLAGFLSGASLAALSIAAAGVTGVGRMITMPLTFVRDVPSRDLISAAKLVTACALSTFVIGASAFANSINTSPAFQANTLARNDDGSSALVGLGFSINYFGTTYTGTYVNNNGHITFGAPFSPASPRNLSLGGTPPMIAPFYGDVDTRSAGDAVTYGTGMVDGREAFGVDWFNVDYFPSSIAHTDRNTFQLLLLNRSDTGAGNFDIYFNYGQIKWGGSGLQCARAGYSSGSGSPRTITQINGSGTCGAFLDNGPNALVTNTNGSTPGQFTFFFRNGQPEPISNINLARPFYLASNLGGPVLPVFQGGTLQINAARIYAGNFTLDTSITNTIDALGNVALFSGVFSDQTAGGRIVIADGVGGGSIIFTGENTYSGGTVINDGATLQVGAGGVIGSIVGDVLDNGALVINRSDDLTLSGVMSGTGSLTKTGAGVLTLTGLNTYSGGTTVSAGGLTATTSSLQGAILNNAVVTFAQTTDGTYAGVMSGTGSLTKTGAGVLTLTGGSSITGETIVQAGTLSLQGRLGTSTLTVASGATLRGTGAVLGNVIINNGGTLAPGNSPGTLTVAGNVTMNAGAVHSVDIDGGVYSAPGGAGSYDRLVLTGAGSVYSAAGTLSPKLRGITGVATNSYSPSIGDLFKIVTADTVAGSFSSVVQPATGMPSNSRFDVLYGSGEIELAITPDSYELLVQNSRGRLNAVNVAASLDAARPAAGVRDTTNLGNLFNGIYGLKSDQLPATLESLSGKVQADIVVSSLDNRRLGRAAAMKRLRSARTAPVEHDSNVWVQVITRTENVNADLVADGYSNHANGYAIGVDHLFSDDFRLGFGHANVSGVVNAGVAGTARDSSQQVFLYGSWQPTADYFVDANVAYAWHGYNTQRSVELRTGAYAYSSHDKTYNWAGDISLGRRIVAGGYIVEPSAGIRWDQVNRGSVSEKGNSIAALNLVAKRDEAVQGKAGVSLSKGFTTGKFEWVPEVHGYFLPRLSGDAMFIERAQLAGVNIVTSSVQKSSGAALVGSGVRVNISNTAHIFFDYDAQLQGGQPAIHSVSGGLNVNF